MISLFTPFLLSLSLSLFSLILSFILAHFFAEYVPIPGQIYTKRRVITGARLYLPFYPFAPVPGGDRN